MNSNVLHKVVDKVADELSRRLPMKAKERKIGM